MFDFLLKVMNMDGSHVGQITKEYAGFIKEAFTKADTFGIACI